MSHFLYTVVKQDGQFSLTMGQWFSEESVRATIAERLKDPTLVHCEYRRHDDNGLCHREYVLPDGTRRLVPIEGGQS